MIYNLLFQIGRLSWVQVCNLILCQNFLKIGKFCSLGVFSVTVLVYVGGFMRLKHFFTKMVLFGKVAV